MRERDSGRRESAVAAGEEIIPGLDLSLSNRNSYNYCGSIRLKDKKKIFREREGMHIIHRSRTAQCCLGLEHRNVAQTDTMLWLSSLRMVKKNCQPSKYFISAFPHGLPFFQFWEPPDRPKKKKSIWVKMSIQVGVSDVTQNLFHGILFCIFMVSVL